MISQVNDLKCFGKKYSDPFDTRPISTRVRTPRQRPSGTSKLKPQLEAMALTRVATVYTAAACWWGTEHLERSFSAGGDGNRCNHFGKGLGSFL